MATAQRDEGAHANTTTTQYQEEASDELDRSIEDSQDEIVMAINANNSGNFGCSYFAANDQSLWLMSDVKYGNVELVDCQVKAQIQPTMVLMPYRVPEYIETIFNPHQVVPSQNDQGDGHFKLPYEIEYRHAAEFSAKAATKKLSEIKIDQLRGNQANFIVPGDHEDFGESDLTDQVGFVARQGQLLKLSATLDMDSRISVGCAGAVCAYLGRRKALQQFPHDVTSQSLITRVEMFSINTMMFVNVDTIASLHILRAESSPNAHNQGPSRASVTAKEGLSVFGLFQRFARSPQGGSLLRNIFSRPTLDLDIITERQDTISTFMKAENETALRNVVKNMGFIRNMRAVVIHLKKGINNATSKATIRSSVWSNIRLFAFHALQIRDALTEMNGVDQLNIGRKIFEGFDTHALALIGTRISNIVDFEASMENHRTVVKHGVNKDLDHMKRSYNGMEDMLNEVSKEIASTISYRAEINVIFFPQIGFLISVPMDPQSGSAGFERNVIPQQAWERIFYSAGRGYYKDDRMRDLDETWGDVYAIICDIEIEIVYQLGQDILEHENVLASASDLCGELDCLVALARGSRQYNFSRPRMTNDNIVQIQGGRHPLQEHCVSSFVPNDTMLSGGPGDVRLDLESSQSSTQIGPAAGESMLMLTGPNFSGKSVYLKQVAIIVYMAHIGCFVPAEKAIIGLTDAILTRVTARETVSKIQSAFMIDLQQVSLALVTATRRSLIILDEIGKGTGTNDGIGLACGVFKYLLSQGRNAPKVLASTHFHELFDNGYMGRLPQLAFGHMEVQEAGDIADAEEGIVHLYTLRPGRKGSSYGNYCALKNGIDADIVTRADYLEKLSARGEDLVAACSTINAAEEDDLQKAEAVARDFLNVDLRGFVLQREMQRSSPDIDPHQLLAKVQ